MTIKQKERAIEEYILKRKGVKVNIDRLKPMIKPENAFYGMSVFETMSEHEHNFLVDKAYKFVEEYNNKTK